MTRLADTFQRLAGSGTIGLFPYLTAGFPDEATSRSLAQAALEAGADGFEIGVPFSDPLADGGTLQRVNASALAAGATLDTALELASFIRERAPAVPVVLMSYYNPLRRLGDQAFARELERVGADGVIVPDLPLEEDGDLRQAMADHPLEVIPMLAPTSPLDRVRAVAARHPAFIYCVALVGVTGARQDLATSLGDFLARVRAETSSPLLLGFGISRPEHVQRAAALGANGVIVASALADLVEHAANPAQVAGDYLRSIKVAVRIPALP